MANKKRQNGHDLLELVYSYSMKSARDACNNCISAEFRIVPPSVGKMCDFWLLLHHHKGECQNSNFAIIKEQSGKKNTMLNPEYFTFHNTTPHDQPSLKTPQQGAALAMRPATRNEGSTVS